MAKAKCITIPQKVKWEEYLAELRAVKVPKLPKDIKSIKRCYLCYKGKI